MEIMTLDDLITNKEHELLLNEINSLRDSITTLELAYNKIMAKLETHSAILDDIARNIPRNLK